MGYSRISDHKRMVFDRTRNDVYAKAIDKVVGPDSIVLDLGAGLGILGFIAARLGAKRVYLVEPEPVVHVAELVAAGNPWNNRIHAIHTTIEEAELPERVDLILSVFTGNFLLMEDLLPSLFHARDRHLKKGGVLLPDRAVMEAVPVSAPELFEENIASWSEGYEGIDLSAARRFAGNTIYYPATNALRDGYLADAAPLLDLDLHNATEASCRAKVTFEIRTAGICHGWAGWFRMRLGDAWLSTAPHSPDLHWSPAFLPLDPPLPVDVGDEISLELIHPQFGDWTWKMESAHSNQQHSTFFGSPMDLARLRKAAADYTPRLSDKGVACQFILSRFNGQTEAAAITDELMERFPRAFSSKDKADVFVRGLLGRFA